MEVTETESAEVREKVHEILIRYSADQTLSVTRDTALVNDLGYHSLAMLEAIFALEDELEIEIVDDSSAGSIATVGDVEDRIVAILEEAGR